MSEKFKTEKDLSHLAAFVAEASAAFNDPSRTIKNSSMPEILGAGLGAGAGGAASFAALWALGTTGLSAAGITSALAAAGALVGGGMVAGIAVLAAPAAVLATIGYAIISKFNHKKLMKQKQALYAEVIKYYNLIIKELENKTNMTKERADYLASLLVFLSKGKDDLATDLHYPPAKVI